MTEQATDVTTKLMRARDLIADPTHWVRDHLAVDVAGKPIHEMDPKAVAWNMAGALWRVGAGGRDGYNRNTVWHALEKTTDSVHRGLRQWHEDPTRIHGDVIAALDRAIELSKKDP